MYKIFFGILISIFCFSCAGSKQIALLKQGEIQTENVYEEIPFRYVKDHLFIDVKINGKTYNFLFDTGFAISAIDDDLIPMVGYSTVLKSKISGSSFEKHKVEFGSIPQVKIGGIDFFDIGFVAEDLYYINEDYLCESHVDGVIGANLLRKAKWQIDYQKQLIRFSDDFAKLKVDPEAIVLNMTAHQGGQGYGSLKLNLDGFESDFIFDTGSSGGFTTGLDAWEEVKKLEADFATKYYGNELAGKALVPTYDVLINEISVEDWAINHAVLSLQKGVNSLIGNDFLRHYQVSMDWDHNRLYLVPVSDYQALPISAFGLLLKADYSTNKVVVGAKRSGTDYKAVKTGMEVSSIDQIAVDSFTQAELCTFWQKEWPKLKSQEQLSLKIKGLPMLVILQQQQYLPPK